MRPFFDYNSIVFEDVPVAIRTGPAKEPIIVEKFRSMRVGQSFVAPKKIALSFRAVVNKRFGKGLVAFNAVGGPDYLIRVGKIAEGSETAVV